MKSTWKWVLKYLLIRQKKNHFWIFTNSKAVGLLQKNKHKHIFIVNITEKVGGAGACSVVSLFFLLFLFCTNEAYIPISSSTCKAKSEVARYQVWVTTSNHRFRSNGKHLKPIAFSIIHFFFVLSIQPLFTSWKQRKQRRKN